MVTDTDISLKNGGDIVLAKRGLIKAQEVRQMTVKAIVDTGAWTLVINEETHNKLGLLDSGVGEATAPTQRVGDLTVNCKAEAEGFSRGSSASTATS